MWLVKCCNQTRVTGAWFPATVCCSLSHKETCHHMEGGRVSGVQLDSHKVSLHFARWTVEQKAECIQSRVLRYSNVPYTAKHTKYIGDSTRLQQRSVIRLQSSVVTTEEVKECDKDILMCVSV